MTEKEKFLEAMEDIGINIDETPHAVAMALLETWKASRAVALEELGAEIAHLQEALAFWLPNVPAESSEVSNRIANDAYLLCGYGGEEKSAQELGWISLAARDGSSEDKTNE